MKHLPDHTQYDPARPSWLCYTTLRDPTAPYLARRDPEVAEDFGKRSKDIGKEDVCEKDRRGGGRQDDPFDCAVACQSLSCIPRARVRISFQCRPTSGRPYENNILQRSPTRSVVFQH
jgi:hypothetical protein